MLNSTPACWPSAPLQQLSRKCRWPAKQSYSFPRYSLLQDRFELHHIPLAAPLPLVPGMHAEVQAHVVRTPHLPANCPPSRCCCQTQISCGLTSAQRLTSQPCSLSSYAMSSSVRDTSVPCGNSTLWAKQAFETVSLSFFANDFLVKRYLMPKLKNRYAGMQHMLIAYC